MQTVMTQREVKITDSYMQDSRHALVSAKYNVLTPAVVGQVMAEHGLELVSLATGNARHEDKAAFQRTISRYRGATIGDGIFQDIVYDSKHMGRGVDALMVGIFRLICANGLVTGKSFFRGEIRHSGNSYDALNYTISAALQQKDRLGALVDRLRNVTLSEEKRLQLAMNAENLLVPSDALTVHNRLLRSRRQADESNDAWTVFNVVQENAVRGGGVVYKQWHTNQQGFPELRHFSSRRIKPNTPKDATVNAQLFDLACSIAGVAV